MRQAAIATCAVLLATPAVAQTTNTNCYTSYGQTYCRSTTQPDPWTSAPAPWTAYNNAYQNGWNQSQQMLDSLNRARQQRAMAEQQRQAQAAEAERAERERQAGAMIAAGNCEDARNYALKAGDFDLAQKVDAACKAPALPVQ